jgi:8-oxo-dGTP pyrophosphatase MutT (NUDIX family)
MKNCIVAGAVVFDKKHERVLLVEHKKLNAWLEPGGHVEQGEFPHEAAIREVFEETGLKVRLIGDMRKSITGDAVARQLIRPFVIMLEDVPFKEEPHTHFDMIYLADTEGEEPVRDHEESTNIRWFRQEEIQSIKTFGNVKKLVSAAFEEIKNLSATGFVQY